MGDLETVCEICVKRAVEYGRFCMECLGSCEDPKVLRSALYREITRSEEARDRVFHYSSRVHRALAVLEGGEEGEA